MNKIISKEQFSEKVFKLEVEAPLIAKSRKAGHFVIVRVDEKGEKYYWLTGEFVNMEPEVEDTDVWAMNNHYISVHPCTIDQTAYAEI